MLQFSILIDMDFHRLVLDQDCNFALHFPLDMPFLFGYELDVMKGNKNELCIIQQCVAILYILGIPC
jgi:hypothetical protein